MFLVDTNVLVYAVDQDSPAHAGCRARVDRWRVQRAPWHVTWSILYEFLRIVTHARVFRRPMTATDALGFLKALLGAPGLEVLVETDRHAAEVEQCLTQVPLLSGTQFHDAHIAVVMKEHGLRRIYTRDADFHRFPFLEVVDPLQEIG